MYKFFDLHCDTLTEAFEKNETLFKNNLHIDFKKMSNFKSSVQVFAIWLQKKYYKNAFSYTKKVLEFYEKQLKKNCETIAKVLDKHDLEKNQKDGKLSSILSIEGGESIGEDLENIEYFYQKGVRLLNICWNYENNLGFGVLTKSEEGLKDFGKKAVLKMNETGIIADVSHLNEAGFWDVYNSSKKTFVATHSNAYSLCDNPRNLKDEQLKAIAEKGGIIGINLYPYFLAGGKEAKIDDVLRHIDYIGNLIGHCHISFGGDFDGIDLLPKGIKNLLGYEKIAEKISAIYGEKICQDICFKNAYNFFDKNL